jgi:protein Mpv17
MSRSAAALLKAPFLAFGRSYNAAAQRRPMATGLVTTVVKTSAADLFAQKASIRGRRAGGRGGLGGGGVGPARRSTQPSNADRRRARPPLPLPAQVMEGKPWEEVDWRRHGLFCTFGFFYLGGFQYYLYNHLFVKWCHGITLRLGHRGSAPIKTFIDQAIQ